MKLSDSLLFEMMQDINGQCIPYIDDSLNLDKYNLNYENYYIKYLNDLKPKLENFIKNEKNDEDEIYTIKKYLDSNKDLEYKISRLIDSNKNPYADVAATIGSDNTNYRKVFIYWVLQPLFTGPLKKILSTIY